MLLCVLSMLIASPLAAGSSCFKEKNSNIGIAQHPKTILVWPGESANISCSTSSREPMIGVYLRRRSRQIMYVHNTNSVTKEPDYETRLRVTGTVLNFTITLRDLSEEDTDLYLCEGAVGDFRDICGQGTLLTVADCASQTDPILNQEFNIRLIIIIIIMAVVICAFLFLVFIIGKVYRARQSRIKRTRLTPNTVYEDMTQISRRNTIGNANAYTERGAGV
ncbi:uncharacterized protein LOC142472632 [Ascaphus truei]|uniref:uncharacterized protein LOC142472632 n=1 Tax=Ascaphus truei TaxID=8439 RepID=UPI003F59A710